MHAKWTKLLQLEHLITSTTEFFFFIDSHSQIGQVERVPASLILLVFTSGPSEPASNKFESNSTTSLANEKESLTVYSLVVTGSMIGTRNLDSLYVGVPIIETIGRNLGRLSTNDLCIFGNP